MDIVQDYPGLVVLGALIGSYLFASFGQRFF